MSQYRICAGLLIFGLNLSMRQKVERFWDFLCAIMNLRIKISFVSNLAENHLAQLNFRVKWLSFGKPNKRNYVNWSFGLKSFGLKSFGLKSFRPNSFVLMHLVTRLKCFRPNVLRNLPLGSKPSLAQYLAEYHCCEGSKATEPDNKYSNSYYVSFLKHPLKIQRSSDL